MTTRLLAVLLVLPACLLTGCFERRLVRGTTPTAVSGAWLVTDVHPLPGSGPPPTALQAVELVEIVGRVTRIHPVADVYDDDAVLRTGYGGVGTILDYRSDASDEHAELAWTYEPPASVGGPLESWQMRVDLGATDPTRATAVVVLGLMYASTGSGIEWSAELSLERY